MGVSAALLRPYARRHLPPWSGNSGRAGAACAPLLLGLFAAGCHQPKEFVERRMLLEREFATIQEELDQVETRMIWDRARTVVWEPTAMSRPQPSCTPSPGADAPSTEWSPPKLALRGLGAPLPDTAPRLRPVLARIEAVDGCLGGCAPSAPPKAR
jgi:hypothetical protein